MLILTRRIGESVVIGNEIICTILDANKNGQLKLAFDAPDSIPIHRFEIQKRIMQRINDEGYESEMNWNETVIERLTGQWLRNKIQ